MTWLRNLLYSIVFYGGTTLIVLFAPLVGLLGQKTLIAYCHGWALLNRWASRYILGVRAHVEGSIPPGPAIYAVKHQAMYETTEMALMLGGPAVVLKRELSRIPFWGWVVMRYGAIVADRSASAKALRSMMKAATIAVDQGRSILIYPEGTRVNPGEMPPLASGFAGLYRLLGLPVVPIAVDTGLVWPRHGPKRPGVVTIRIGETVPPGLKREELEARVHAAINALETNPA